MEDLGDERILKDSYKIPLSSILCVLLVGIIVYANTFTAPFTFDDFESIPKNSTIANLANFYANSTGYDFLPNRYVTYLTFALNYHFGGLDVFGYHGVNLLIHLLNALLVYLLLQLTFRTPFLVNRVHDLPVDKDLPNFSSGHSSAYLKPSVFIPLFAALLFVVHPVQTQAVTYIVQRATSLATMFYLLAMVLFCLARLSVAQLSSCDQRSEEKAVVGGEGGSVKSIFLIVGSVIAAVLAMKTKEIAFTLPLAAVMYEFCFFPGLWKRRLLHLLPLLATMLIIPLTILDPGGEASVEAPLDIGESLRVDSDISRSAYFFTQLRVIVTYLRLLVLPYNQNLDYDYPVYQSLLSLPVFLSFLLLVTLVVLAVYLSGVLRHSSCSGPFRSYSARCESRLIAFGLFWFFLTLSVESSFIPIVDVIMEHRLYLPGFGWATVLATVAFLAVRQCSKLIVRRLIISGAFSLLLLLGLMTWQRNHLWQDPVRLWSDVVAKSPFKSRSYNNLGFALTDNGRYKEAISNLSRAIELAPDHPHAYNNLGRAYILNGQVKDSLPVLKIAIMLDPEYVDAYISLAAAFNQLGQYLNTMALLEKNFTLISYRVEASYHLAVAYASLGYDEAFRKQLTIVNRFDPELATELRGFFP